MEAMFERILLLGCGGLSGWTIAISHANEQRLNLRLEALKAKQELLRLKEDAEIVRQMSSRGRQNPNG